MAWKPEAKNFESVWVCISAMDTSTYRKSQTSALHTLTYAGYSQTESTVEWCEIVLPFVLSICEWNPCEMWYGFVVIVTVCEEWKEKDERKRKGPGKNQSAWHAGVTHLHVVILLALNKQISGRAYKLCHRDFFARVSVRCSDCSGRCVFAANSGLCFCLFFIFYLLFVFVCCFVGVNPNPTTCRCVCVCVLAFQIWYSITSIYLCYARSNVRTHNVNYMRCHPWRAIFWNASATHKTPSKRTHIKIGWIKWHPTVSLVLGFIP